MISTTRLSGRRRSAGRGGLICLLAAACCGCGTLAGWCGWPWRTASIPDRYPLGSVNRAHYQTMETNGEAGDFILYRHEFVADGTDLTPYGKDHILEIAARAGCGPFPVIVERSEHNNNPQLDQRRRALVAQVLGDCGVTDAQQRTIIAPAYEKPTRVDDEAGERRFAPN
jgi:hypothetical protein